MIVSVSFWPWRFWCWLCIWREGCYVRESLFFFLTERKRCWHFLSKFQYSEVHSICRKKATMSFCRRKQKILIILSWLSRITCITCLNCITCFTRFTGNPKNINHWLTDNLKSRDASVSLKCPSVELIDEYSHIHFCPVSDIECTCLNFNKGHKLGCFYCNYISDKSFLSTPLKESVNSNNKCKETLIEKNFIITSVLMLSPDRKTIFTRNDCFLMSLAKKGPGKASLSEAKSHGLPNIYYIYNCYEINSFICFSICYNQGMANWCWWCCVVCVISIYSYSFFSLDSYLFFVSDPSPIIGNACH